MLLKATRLHAVDGCFSADATHGRQCGAVDEALPLSRWRRRAMGLGGLASLDLQINLVSEHVGAVAWTSAKADEARLNCVGFTTLRVCCCKGVVKAVPAEVLPADVGCSVADLPGKF